MWHKRRTPVAVVREWRLPGPERRAARAERRVEAAIRRERDSEWTADRRAAALEAEAWREPGLPYRDLSGAGRRR
jgi:hypothetical protein